MIPFCDPDRCVAAGCTPTVCTGAGLPSNDVMFERASAVIPGGVNSSIRAFRSVGGRPYTVARAEGAHLWDVEGTRYIDLVQSYGAVILGHAHPAITAAVTAAVKDGTSYGAPTPREMKLAEVISDRVPSCEQVRFMNSGTEATSTAVRLARGYTGRDRVVIFHGNFHGATDALLAAGGSGVATLGLPGTAGVPASAVAETLVVPYNAVPELDSDVAAVLVEPVAANMGVIGPEPGFLEGLRAECDRVGAVLVFDEVITGFRLGSRRRAGQVRRPARSDDVRQGHRRRAPGRGGRWPARADGDPVADRPGVPCRHAVGQPDRHRRRPRRARPVDARHLHRVDGQGPTSGGRAARRLQRRRVRRPVPVVGTLVGMVCGDVPRPVDFAGAKRTDTAAYGRFFHAMLRNGVAMAPGAYEAIFVGVAHTDDVIDAIAAAAHRAAAEAAETSETSELSA